jgi:hypothetical protein
MSQKNVSPKTMGQRPPMPFAIANNLLAPKTRVADLGISPQTTTTITYNNSKNLEDGSSSMKHPRDAHKPS